MGFFYYLFKLKFGVFT